MRIGFALLLGFFDWLLPFVVSFVIFPLRKGNYYLFESLMTVLVVLSAVIFSVIYFTQKVSLREGVVLGILWLAINLVIDLLLFLPKSPMQMPFSVYMSQIGVKYLSIPIITIGIAVIIGKVMR
jgi:hypothetical protein